jgi:hypothetical protein
MEGRKCLPPPCRFTCALNSPRINTHIQFYVLQCLPFALKRLLCNIHKWDNSQNGRNKTCKSKCREASVHHRVGRVLSFSPVVGIGTSPSPHLKGSVPPPLWCRGEGHTRWREKGWEIPNSDEGTYTAVLFIYMYFVVCTLNILLYVQCF